MIHQHQKITHTGSALLAAAVMALTVTACGSDDGAAASGPVDLPNYLVSVSWAAPTQRENSDSLPSNEIAGYRIYYGVDPGDYIESLDVAGGITNLTVTGLFNRNYYYVITAYDTEGRESVFSDEAVITTSELVFNPL